MTPNNIEQSQTITAITKQSQIREGRFSVNGQKFYWCEISQTNRFSQLQHIFHGIVKFDVLRIKAEEFDFDIAIRIDGRGTQIHYLGPALVIGTEFPNCESPVSPEIMIELRPKLCRLPDQVINNSVAERIVQWAQSSKFRVIRVNAIGGLWVGWGESDNYNDSTV